jgi:hypothetical protein
MASNQCCGAPSGGASMRASGSRIGADIDFFSSGELDWCRSDGRIATATGGGASSGRMGAGLGEDRRGSARGRGGHGRWMLQARLGETHEDLLVAGEGMAGGCSKQDWGRTEMEAGLVGPWRLWTVILL